MVRLDLARTLPVSSLSGKIDNMDVRSSKSSKVEIVPGLTPPKLRLAGHRASEGKAVADRDLSNESLLQEARQLLVTLKVDRSRIEARLAEFGREDPIEVVKGRSALDRAIEECQEVIERLDQLVHATKST